MTNSQLFILSMLGSGLFMGIMTAIIFSGYTYSSAIIAIVVLAWLSLGVLTYFSLKVARNS